MNTVSDIHSLFATDMTGDGSWVSQLANFIVHPIITLILTCLIFCGFLFQLYSKRINVIGILSTIVLLIFFLGFLVKGEVNLLSIILFILGVILVVIELFVVGAVIGIIGIGLIIFSIVTLGNSLVYMVGNVVVALILAIIEWVILVKVCHRTIPLLQNVVLNDSTSAEAGFTSHDDRSHLVGQTALTLTDLRPAGMISIDNERIDAVSDGAFILRNKQVRVLEVEGTRVVVRELES
ncbi:NfeD family protein [Staphylococcus pettenkoferi]|uniref:NfeD family protein n=1 Tax=Staphylococcus pettenkoferi TaxID=170573 RepID=UPI00066C0369|nr:NfeD family protein [Staphylococcus pettenkoferi]MCI2804542.1 serine protease [Staphylococcus pettenkoferi]MCY1574410.1 serine protease [Staphylococcus pettenkoferi]MCY1579521.1 serine protease [Staphylococcus pettenkoferi]MCY1586624.1 serine protease [Staphylococcus pettenkoferi]MCY1616644.1 serine protease [Staphylococcus pettenkoferi]